MAIHEKQSPTNKNLALLTQKPRNLVTQTRYT